MGKAGECAGVAFFGEASSIDADSKAVEWACKYLRVPKKYTLKIIHVNKLNNANAPPRMLPGSRYGSDDVATKLKDMYPAFSEKKIEHLQTTMLQHEVSEEDFGVTYEGENFKAALEHAIQEEHLDTLVLACWVADDTKGPPINSLESQGCSIVLAKVDSRKQTFSMPPTEGSAATAAAAAAATAAAQASGSATPTAAATAAAQAPHPVQKEKNKETAHPSTPSKSSSSTQ